MDRRNLTRARRALIAIDDQQRQQTAVRLGWLARSASYGREHVRRDTASGADWFRTNGVPRAWVGQAAARARAATDPDIAWMFTHIATEILFPLRRPVGE